MDHQHYQPIWPLLEGAFDYTMNLASELWTMIWGSVEQRRMQRASTMATQYSQKEVGMKTADLHANKPRTSPDTCMAEERKGER
jgi:hypothetical protein